MVPVSCITACPKYLQETCSLSVSVYFPHSLLSLLHLFPFIFFYFPLCFQPLFRLSILPLFHSSFTFQVYFSVRTYPSSFLCYFCFSLLPFLFPHFHSLSHSPSKIGDKYYTLYIYIQISATANPRCLSHILHETT